MVAADTNHQYKKKRNNSDHDYVLLFRSCRHTAGDSSTVMWVRERKKKRQIGTGEKQLWTPLLVIRMKRLRLGSNKWFRVLNMKWVMQKGLTRSVCLDSFASPSTFITFIKPPPAPQLLLHTRFTWSFFFFILICAESLINAFILKCYSAVSLLTRAQFNFWLGLV